jgi:hypothetical protein
MRKNVILVPPYHSYGDVLSSIGIIYYLLTFYDNVYLFINVEDGGFKTLKYYEEYFKFDPFFNKRIFITSNPKKLIDDSDYGDYDIVNNRTGDWLSAKNDFFDEKKIDKRFYFNDLNPLYNSLDIPLKHQTNPNTHLPNQNIEINHLFYYKLIGLNNTVRMDYFNYFRNLENEENYSKIILNGHGLKIGDKYNIINDPVGKQYLVKDKIDNNYPIINISDAAPCIGFLMSLVEKAESVHFIEGNNVNFFYHSQYKGIFTFNKPINFYVNLRNRNWEYFNLDYAWKMLTEPKLDNWNFIF